MLASSFNNQSILWLSLQCIFSFVEHEKGRGSLNHLDLNLVAYEITIKEFFTNLRFLLRVRNIIETKNVVNLTYI